MRKWEQPGFFRTPTSLDDAKGQLRKEKKLLKQALAARADAEKAQYSLGVKIAEDDIALRLASVAHFETWIQSHASHPATPRHHATKKSPAQLQREVDEVLAHPGKYSYEEAMEALEKKHAGAPRGGSLRSGHAPVVPKTAPSVLQLLKTYKARVRFEDQLKKVSQSRDPNRPRWTAFVQGAFGHDVVGEGVTKEAAARAAVAELPPHIRRHFEGV
jgi:hypothetical protein